MQSILKNKYFPSLIYWICAIVLFVYLDYWRILFMHPQGIHFMRQTDSLSFVIHYLKSGMHFFEPGILNLESKGGVAASEFPILYYITAWLYKLTGEHEYYLKLMNMSLVFLGFFGVFRIMMLRTGQLLLSLSLTFLLFGSMVVFYYTNNYLPDAPAFGLTLFGLSFYCKFMNEGFPPKEGLSGLIIMLLASLIKVSNFVYPIAAITIMTANDLLLNRMPLQEFFKLRMKMLICFATGTLAIACWAIYVKHLNQVNHGTYFLVKSRSWLIGDEEERANVWRHITGWWADSYYPRDTKMFLLYFFGLGILFFRKKELKWLLLSFLCLMGALAFFFLFFLQFKDHDYYFIALVPAIIIGTAYAAGAIVGRFNLRIITYIVTIISLYFAVTGVAFSKNKLWWRYGQSKEDIYAMTGHLLNGADKVLDRHGIDPNAPFIFIIDRNINGAAYFTRRFGWPITDTASNKLSVIPEHIANGAQYILLTDPAFANIPMIKNHIGTAIISEAPVFVYPVRSAGMLK